MKMQWLEGQKENLTWIAVGVCMLALCLLVTFPYAALHTRLQAELNHATGMEVRVADWTVSLPLGLEWRNVTVGKPDWGPVHLAVMHAKVGILKALGGEFGLDLTGRFDEAAPTTGLAKGTFTASSFSMTGPMSVKGQLQQVDLSKVVRRYVSQGILNGDFSHRIDSLHVSTDSIKGEGTWKADVKDLALEQIPLGNGRMLSLAFARVSVGLTCQNALCEIMELKGDGIDGSFNAEGKITLQQPLQNSQLALTVTVIPGAGFAAKAPALGLPPLPPGTPMTVKLVGTLAQARIAL